ncbi:MAG: arsenate reductase [Chitinophagaceae bacterium]|nr:arsenate reductase [Chitinophagaceae bacterium]
MKKVYYLGTCTTCQRILKETGLEKKGFILQDIKTEKITAAQLTEMKQMAGSYEALFSRRSMKYQSMGLKDKTLTEKDFRKLILTEYTFLKRPVIIIGTQIFIGNAKKTIEDVKKSIAKTK